MEDALKIAITLADFIESLDIEDPEILLDGADLEHEVTELDSVYPGEISFGVTIKGAAGKIQGAVIPREVTDALRDLDYLRSETNF